ncbi:thioredoxin fold domain-containing protein [Candidatus Dependentiae bacterium]|nr:thioredoxin fold domain-containing protein [Candidatus Dependentiae bacterium]MCC7414854.1 thioredoxin fold domain-containing protein [Campylobacterota bacterium]
MQSISNFRMIMLVFIIACIGILTFHLINRREADRTSFSNTELVTVVEAEEIPAERPAQPSTEVKPAKAAQTLQEITNKAELDELLSNTDKPVVVKFFATWCPPCKALTPIYKASAGELSHKAYFAEIDIDQFAEKDHLDSLGVQSLPTIILFKDGKEAKRLNSLSGKALAKELDSL